MKLPILYKNMSTQHPTTGKPALEEYKDISALIQYTFDVCTLDSIQQRMEKAENDYGGKWFSYSVALNRAWATRYHAITNDPPCLRTVHVNLLNA